MARFRCRTCGKEDTFDYTGRRACPHCGSDNVQFALSIEELSDDDLLIIALTALAKNEPPEAND